MDSHLYFRAVEEMGRDAYKRTAKFRVKVKPGRAGPWRVRRFTTRLDLAYARFFRDGRAPGLGTFTALNHDERGLVMSDTAPEIFDLLRHIGHLKGNVLVTGLGLGMVIHILTKVDPYRRDVKSITVIEKDADVIKLTGKYYASRKVKIIKADAYVWKPPEGVTFDCAWHDIWDNDDLFDRKQYHTIIKRHYRGIVPAGKQFCWGRK